MRDNFRRKAGIGMLDIMQNEGVPDHQPRAIAGGSVCLEPLYG